MKNVKFKFLTTTLLLLTLILVATLTSCGGGETITDIVIKNTNQPRLTYVQGQDLDLSAGVITALMGGSETSVPMTASDVSVTGYDKNALGKQTVTVTYKEKSTTLEVNVIARMTAENFETNYFAKDTFNASKGRLKIAKDDATTFTVNFDNDAVSLKSFDSTKAGKATVTLAYKNADGTEYTCDFTVNVFDIGEVVFTPPYKTTYESHETKLDLSGGYFTVKANNAVDFSRYIDITEDMVIGYKPQDVTMADRNTPVSQTLVFTYAEQSFNLPITVKFSGVSIFNELAKELTDIDWSAESVTISDEDGLVALDAMTEYYKLTSAKKDLIDEETLNTVVRPAALYINRLFSEEFNSFSNSFGVDAAGYLVILANSYEQAKTDYDRLCDSNEKINVYGEILRNIQADFKDVVLREETTIGDYIIVLTVDDIDYITKLLAHMMELHDILSVVPNDWTIDTLSEYERAISSATSEIKISELYGPSYSSIYFALSKWRDKDDYFDIIYSYYLYVYEGEEDYIKKNMWQIIPLPTALQEWYLSIYNANSHAYYMKTNTDTAYLYDTSTFMYYYFNTIELANAVKEGDNQLCKDLYELFEGDTILDTQIRKAAAGYMYHAGELLGTDKYEDVWEKYLVLVKLYYTQTGIKLEDYKAEFSAAFNAVAELSPAELYAFISSMHFLYDSSRGNVLVFDYSENIRSMFVYLIGSYYIPSLGENVQPLFQQLLIAMESYALHSVKETAIEDFNKAMSELIDGYNNLTGEDKANFDEHLLKAYSKYFDIYTALESEEEINLGDWEAKFDELIKLLNSFCSVQEYLSTDDETLNKTGVYTLLFSIYERANKIYSDISENGGEDVLTALYTNIYNVNEVELTADKAFYRIRGAFIIYMLNSTITQKDAEGNETVHLAWDLYSKTDIDNLLPELLYVMLTTFENGELDKATVISTILNFKNASIDSIAMFYTIGSSYYYNAVIEFFKETLPEDVATIGEAILKAESAYFVYLSNPSNEEAVTNFKSAMESVIELYNDLTNTESFNEYLKSLYDHYIAKYNELAK